MMMARLIKRSLIAMCVLASAPCLATADLEPSVTEPLTAIWNVQRFEFNYRSANVYYSCESLRHKIASIVTAVGARKGADVAMYCRPGGLTNAATMVITLASPIQATAENVTAATTYSTQTQLAARVNGIHLPTANDIDRFAAEWRVVELNRNRTLNLQAGDCELLHGMIDQVFPRLAVRVEKKRLNCSHGSTSRVRPVLHVAALMPAPVAGEPVVPMAYVPASK